MLTPLFDDERGGQMAARTIRSAIMDFDVIVVGAGPAGSSSAIWLARGGANVLLVDRASFPRDKPCGGAVTGRAADCAPCSIDPVVERVVTSAEIRGPARGSIVREAERPIAYMTRRRRLDHFLVEQAARAGAEVWDGAGRVTVESSQAPVVNVRGKPYGARVVIGADGANGSTARALGLGDNRAMGVAIEGNLPRECAPQGWEDGRLLIQLGIVAGGYGWIFPKDDHLNVGVGGWSTEGPRLRDYLGGFCRHHGIAFDALQNLQGHRLPMGRRQAPLARDAVCLVGDAAGLVDPLTGDGMFESFLSGRLASEAALGLIEGRTQNLLRYHDALSDRLKALNAVSWTLKRAFDRFPRLSYRIATSTPVWSTIRDILTGELRDIRAASTARTLTLRVIEQIDRRSPLMPLQGMSSGLWPAITRSAAASSVAPVSLDT
jgi:geranylgeranyl reductase family protein